MSQASSVTAFETRQIGRKRHYKPTHYTASNTQPVKDRLNFGFWSPRSPYAVGNHPPSWLMTIFRVDVLRNEASLEAPTLVGNLLQG